MGFFGLLVGWAIIAVWWRRWLLIPLLLLGVVFVVLALTAVPPNWATILLSVDDPIGAGVVLRLDMWSRALAMLADMPYTGIGLNTFPLIQTHFYTGHLLGPEPHAHNLILQTALDLGLPGLLAFLWLLAAFYLTAWRAGRQLADRWLQAVVIGAVAGVTAYVAGGVLDVMTLGAKPVAALTLFLGLVGALGWLSEPAAAGEPAARRAQLAGLATPAILLLALILSVVLRPATVLVNLALIPAHQSIYAARQLGRLPPTQLGQAVEWLPQAIRQDPDNPELYGAYGSVLAWSGDPAAALETLARRVALDARDPYAYAPFLAWQRDLTGEPPESAWQTLQRVYQHWQLRFPERAENQALLSLVHEQGLGDGDGAAAILAGGLQEGATPRSLLEYYQSALAGDGAAETSKSP
jgi:hypothetical protein